ncbi:hypothetical protein RO3G_02916 [Rhizopus delemar RA 99-880]|uniref:DH domain-containing protein n=1 Tax=Rhizopus delemar (strain RA 99-880 / ATCC MYA-4621 / FGSC 9543 / NRRL 43880) TaxID=246409 RepID=I1BPT2_RHIO9|nr:hypothetical protein RO3G_02916 [Rhizopus delemar RA 99-880]|eukprot:EIE78212.1 hypothetical protein RO3G_02916 [Rhizopus delemar RA 99-880]
MEPVQRISRYSMMLKNILSLTPNDHPDYWGLKWVCDKSREIAIMDDDGTTKKITLLMTLYQIIKVSPCLLVNQTRSFVCHLDVLEINCITNKSSRKLTLFLFTDKILVASRPCCFDIEQLESKKLKNTAKNTLRFKCRADIKSVELSVGLPVYNKTRALRRQFESSDKTYYKLWNNVPVFCNVYNQDTFIKSKYKSPCVLVYVDQEHLDTETITSSSSSIIGLVQPEGLNGFRFHLATTTQFAEPFRPYLKDQQPIVDFESIFWNNKTPAPVFPLKNISRSASSVPKFHRLFDHEDLTQVKFITLFIKT